MTELLNIPAFKHDEALVLPGVVHPNYAALLDAIAGLFPSDPVLCRAKNFYSPIFENFLHLVNSLHCLGEQRGVRIETPRPQMNQIVTARFINQIAADVRRLQESNCA